MLKVVLFSSESETLSGPTLGSLEGKRKKHMIEKANVLVQRTLNFSIPRDNQRQNCKRNSTMSSVI